jgi:hypothetical protein
MIIATAMSKEHLSLHALGTYVLYRTVNHLRHASVACPNDRRHHVGHVMHESLHEAARGHDRLGKLIAGTSAPKTGSARREGSANERPTT